MAPNVGNYRENAPQTSGQNESGQDGVCVVSAGGIGAFNESAVGMDAFKESARVRRLSAAAVVLSLPLWSLPGKGIVGLVLRRLDE